MDCDLNFVNSATINSPFLVVPKSKMGYQLWRLYSYQFLHGGWEHLFGNAVLQLLIGIPLEVRFSKIFYVFFDII